MLKGLLMLASPHLVIISNLKNKKYNLSKRTQIKLVRRVDLNQVIYVGISGKMVEREERKEKKRNHEKA